MTAPSMTLNPMAASIKTLSAVIATVAVVLTTLFVVNVTDDKQQPTPAIDSGMVLDAQGAPDSVEGLAPETQGSLRDFVSAVHLNDYDTFMSDPQGRARFLEAFQAGLDEQQSPKPTSDGGQVQNVLAYGFDRDHVWVTASYADMARGLVWGAVNFCKRYIPAYVCNAAGNWLTSMARGYAPMSNHGVWGALYWNRYTGGRW